MKISSISLLFLSFVFFMSCKKDDKTPDAPTTPDCKINNYGVLRVSFGATDVQHGIIVTPSGSTTGTDKAVAIGQTSDTIRLAPGTYNINIYSANNANQAIEDETFTLRIVTQCNETNLKVIF